MAAAAAARSWQQRVARAAAAVRARGVYLEWAGPTHSPQTRNERVACSSGSNTGRACARRRASSFRPRHALWRATSEPGWRRRRRRPEGERNAHERATVVVVARRSANAWRRRRHHKMADATQTTAAVAVAAATADG